jgi:hypothetical protein
VASWTVVSLIAPPRKRGPNARTIWVILGSIVAIAVIAVLLANTADSGNDTKPRAANGKPTPTVPKSPPLKLKVGKVVVQNTGPPAKVTRAIRRSLLSSTQFYVDGAIIAPLSRGQLNKQFATVFDSGVRKAAARNDVAVLTESTTGRARGVVTAKASPVRIDAIGDPTGKLTLAATSFTMNVKATTPAGRIVIRRKTELTFANESGKWFVTAYNVTVRRTVGAKTASKTISATSDSSGVSS